MQTPFELSNQATWTSYQDGEDFCAALAAAHPSVTLHNYGSSVNGRVIRGVAVGYPTPKLTGPTVMYVTAQHGNEPAGREAAYAMMRDLAETPTWQQEFYLRGVTWVFLPNCNPDNLGLTRLNVNGQNINNGYPTPPHPEGRAIINAIARTRPTLIIDSHEGGISFNEDLAADAASAEDLPASIRDLSNAAVDAVEAGLLAQGRTYARFSGGDTYTILRNSGALLHACTVLLESFQSKNNDVTKPGRAMPIRISDQLIAMWALFNHHMANRDLYIQISTESRYPGYYSWNKPGKYYYRSGGVNAEVERMIYRTGGVNHVVWKAGT